jgi:hypothetical protein
VAAIASMSWRLDVTMLALLVRGGYGQGGYGRVGSAMGAPSGSSQIRSPLR